MTVTYLKRAGTEADADERGTRELVADMLTQLEAGGEPAVRAFSRRLDDWDPPSFVVTEDAVRSAEQALPPTLRDDIVFAYTRVREFADRQRESLVDVDVELLPGLVAGHRHLPVDAAGCYVPGGRFAHIASALMSITTARAAGVPHVVACSPPRQLDGRRGIPPATLFAMAHAGADTIMCLGGVQAIAAMAFGLVGGGVGVDVVAGPGNRYVAEAKRLLYGRVGIDVFAGPSEALVVADDTADPWLVAVDLVSQAEHGPDSPVVLVSTSRALAEQALELVASAIGRLPEPTVAQQAFQSRGEVVVVDDRDEAARLVDEYAYEHVEVHAADLGWWARTLTTYGSLFLGEETTVTYGDKASGPNHILPTLGAARYTGGLWVGKFLRTVTHQQMTRDASCVVGAVAARLSRAEGMHGHAMAADARLTKYRTDPPADTAGPERGSPPPLAHR
jgi:sulfopropanediol 3-dehydrogenase